MTKEQLASEIFKSSHLNGEFLLRSGKISNEYFDKYKFESKPGLLIEIAKFMSELIPSDTELLAGLEMGGIPLATAISIQTGIKCVFVRKNAKEYGTRKIAEGEEFSGKKIVIIEDVVTSGGQIVLSTKDLRQAGGIVDTALCVIDRESGGAENLVLERINLIPLFTMSYIKSNV